LTHSPTANVTITRNIITGIMTVLIWGALVLEAFLAFWVSTVEDSEEEDEEMVKVGFSANGATKKKAKSRS